MSDVLAAIVDNGPTTAKVIGASTLTIKPLEDDGLVERKGSAKVLDSKTGEPTRGRPAIVFAATRKGRDRVKRERAKA